LIENLPFDDAEDRLHVDAVVLVEALILDGDERLRDVKRQRFERDARAILPADLTDRRPVAAKTSDDWASGMIRQASPV
jgi:hypothetical protein